MISIRQFNKVYKEHFLDFLKLGFQPSYNDVIEKAGKDLPDVSTVDEPLYRFKPQGRNQIFDTVLYNKSVKKIGDDLELVFEELNDVTKQNIKRVLHSDLFHAVHSSELNRLKYSLDALLFETSGADDNFFVQFEDFSSTSKTDSENSDAAIVNTAEGKLVLPVGMKGTLKVDLSHIENSGVPIDLQVSTTTANNLGNIPGTKFGNIVKDSIFPWGLVLESLEDGPLEISFTIRLKNEEFVNKISLLHHGEKKQNCQIRTSVDKANLKNIEDYAEGVILSNQSQTVSLDFEDRLVDYIHINLKKEEADSSEELPGGAKIFRYIFGLKNISIFSTGRKEKATYQSLPFDFSDSIDAIGRVSLTSQVSIPEDTDIDFAIAGVYQDGTTSQFLPITPDNYTNDTGPPKVRVLQDTINESIDIISNENEAVLVDSQSNIDFYNIASIPTKPIFGSAYLNRGRRSWLRDNSKAVNPVLVKDNFIPFSKGDTQSLYTILTESVTAVVTNVNNTNKYVVVLAKSPLYDAAKGHFVSPQNDANPDVDTQPNYAVYNVTYNLANPASSTAFTFETASVASGGGVNDPRTFDTGVQLIKYIDNTSVTLQKLDQSYTYINGIDYIIVLDEEGYPTGEITGIHPDLTAEDPANPGTWISVRLSYELDTNLTRFVESIAGQQVYLSIEVGQLSSSGSLIVTYRHKAEEILKASVKAKSKFGIIKGQIYTQGVDYIFDSLNGTIQRLSTGGIEPGQDIYIDYKYNDTSEQLEQFFIWAQVDDSVTQEDLIIKVEVQDTGFFSNENTLTPDTEKGEELLVSLPGLGIVNLNNSVEWPAMNGWVQFIVKSTNPDEFDNALIRQIIKLKDLEQEFIFLQSGKYFSNLTAIRDPLTQVSYPVLKHNTLKKDHTRFAIRETLGGSVDYQVVLNFEPNSDPILYRYAPNSEIGTSENDEIIEVPEEWTFKWSTPQVSDTSVQKIIVKIDLNRNTATDGNITPKVNDFFVKVGV